ncbi:MAG: ATP-binding cassette domain-containing protein [Desulfovibrionaceae bacterium]|nr:ATP-binding cassette domain-containing protein [Desulfovibrionaceae bacterium]
MAPVIVARDLRKRYAGFAPVLRGVNLEVEPGELVAIMGPSGCGKSTMLHVLGMLHAPDSGTVQILGKDVLAMNREETSAFRRDNVGFIMQQSNLFDHSTVFENVEFPLIYKNVPDSQRWPRVIYALELVRLSSRVHYASNRLSGGEQQRVAIARAMVNNPRILMADEPTGALDQNTSRLIMENFRKLCHSGGVALVMVTHDAKMAEYCDSVYTLEEGVLVCQRRQIPEISRTDGVDLLSGPDIRLHTAMVADNFLRPEGVAGRTAAHLLQQKGLLTHVATLSGGTLLGREMESYSLPMPVCHMGGIRATNVMKAWLCGSGAPKKEYAQDAQAVKAILQGACSVRWARAQASELAAWAAREGVQCLYAAAGSQAPAVCWLASKASGIPYGLEVRSTDSWLSRLDKPAVVAGLAVLVRDALFVRCASETVQQRILPVLPAEYASKIRFIPDPVTLMPMDEEVSICQVHEASKLPHILASGALEHRKGYDVLLKALARLVALGREFRCTIAGTGPAAKELKSQAKAMGLLKYVTFAGLVPHANMNSLYMDADVFVAPGVSRQGESADGIPSALAEAMAFFLPVVASDLPDQKWLVGDAGHIVPAGDDAALANVIEPLLDTESEAMKRRTQLGQKAHDRVVSLLGSVGDDLSGLFRPLLK